ncbi:pentapeptide repeat-containing protein [Streptomyces mirabilis]|uniref:pentapeptide repeat-containing protein n=1 Tax=Streptomyces mirabilis TaxID=68239 RepID=UPI003695477F
MILSLPGLAALAALLFTWMQVGQTGRELQISEQGQITNRFNTAIGNLGSGSVDVRLGGIYALERIMHDSARDHPTVVSVLSAYLRHHAPVPASTTSAEGPPPADIDAVLNVLAGRRPDYDKGLSINLSHTDLREWTPAFPHAQHSINLIGADLTGTDLSKADLAGAQLSNAVMSKASLREASLLGADLSNSFLDATDLRDASLVGANLSDASFCSEPGACADMTDTDLHSANLTSASLPGANLTKATLCSDTFIMQIATGRTFGGECARLRNAELAGTNLSKVDLSGVDLGGADLTGANLSKANLSKANLIGAHLTRVKLDGARLDGVRGLPQSLHRPPKG